MRKTHHCSELNKSHVGSSVCLAGWVDAVRDHGGVLFVDLRDREGKTQIVIDPKQNEFTSAHEVLKPESVIEINGKVLSRTAERVNKDLPTGEIEVEATALLVHNVSAPVPFQIDDSSDKVNEELRLAHRYLDLRRPSMFNNLRLRSNTAQSMRRYLDSRGFLEVETPYMFKSTPEGAREFLVPSRHYPGQFYALAQSPQQYKQMLMVAGVERYYQLARCFRDEDFRADRQLEFTQLDAELSFIDREDIYSTVEGMMSAIWKEVLGLQLKTPIPRLSYHEVMNRFGIDKPDIRYELELKDLSDCFKATQFKVFTGILDNGGVVKALNLKGLGDVTEGEMKNLEATAKTMGAPGLAYIKVDSENKWKSPIVKFFSPDEVARLTSVMKIEAGDLVFFAAGEWETACEILGRLRVEGAALLVKRAKLTLDPSNFQFLWVIEFPLMIFDKDAGRYLSAHHPFTAPVPEDVQYLDSDPKRVRGQHYDLVLNGFEIMGGSIRIHQPELQKKVFEDVLKIDKELVESRFGYFLTAFKYGAPPHGGFAIGFDRLVTLMAKRSQIRDLIAFPKNQKAIELMNQSPTEVTAKQLKDLHIQVVQKAPEAANS